jgi:hypothetical protein
MAFFSHDGKIAHALFKIHVFRHENLGTDYLKFMFFSPRKMGYGLFKVHAIFVMKN